MHAYLQVDNKSGRRGKISITVDILPVHDAASDHQRLRSCFRRPTSHRVRINNSLRLFVKPRPK